MSGTRAGGENARDTILRKHGPDFYVRIGAIGGSKGRTGGFGHPVTGKALARRAGRLGGLVSRRGKSKQHVTQEN